MRSIVIKLTSLLLTLAFLAGCAGFMQDGKANTENTLTQPSISTSEVTTSAETAMTTADQLNFQHKRQEKEIGFAEAIADYSENYAYCVYYPVTGNPAIDVQIKATAKKITDDFTAGISDNEAGSAQKQAVMTADYTAYIETDNKIKTAAPEITSTKAAGTTATEKTTGNKTASKQTAKPVKIKTYSYLSIVFEITVDVPGTTVSTQKIRTCMFDQNTGKLLAPGDIFFDDYLSMVSKKTAASFKADKSYGEAAKTEIFQTNIAPKAENFSSFVVYGGKAVFYFDQLRTITGSSGCPSVAIPLSQLHSVLKVKITQRAEIRHMNGQDKLIALTFDDGPKTADTNRILDALEKAGGRATFFILGLMVNKNSAALKREFLMGCDIGNHSFNHKKMSLSMSSKAISAQVSQTAGLIKKVTGETPKFFRMPYGYRTERASAIINMPIIGWDVDSRDWAYKDVIGRTRSKSQRESDKKKVINGILNAAQDGDIVLMHDIYGFSAEVAEVIIPELVKRGYKLVTVSELFAARGITPENGKYYRSARK